jgi:hypothetical protein
MIGNGGGIRRPNPIVSSHSSTVERRAYNAMVLVRLQLGGPELTLASRLDQGEFKRALSARNSGGGAEKAPLAFPPDLNNARRPKQ